ncbi:MAG: argininosuccinate synthase [Gammaproteobacteria bacterium]|nr:argininosuccinate synthase [Gammaproteobacteria bacterium]
MGKKIVLAYSGGLDTSVMCRWLQDTQDAEVVTFTADIGQGKEVEQARAKAEAMGVTEIFIEDLTEEFVRDYVFPMFHANAIYEGEYLLGTSIARPLIAKRLVEVAAETGAGAIAHGATGKGNDQVRFELSAYALNPDIQVIAPWREPSWDLRSREACMAYAQERQIPVEFKRGFESPYSMDANLLHISYEGGGLEDPGKPADEAMWRWTVSPEQAPDEAQEIDLDYETGNVVAVDGKPMTPATVLRHLNEVGGRHGIGRSDIVENRYVGMKSRGCYETPGGTILLKGHRAMESITLDREVAHLKDELMPRYASLIYNGYWFAPERLAIQALLTQTQKSVNGRVRLKLYKGGVSVIARSSETDSLYDAGVVTFEDDAGAYDQADATGFIRLNALRLRLGARRRRE